MTTIYKIDETQPNMYVDLTNGDAIVYLTQFTTPGKSYSIEDVLGKASPTHSINIVATEGTMFSSGEYSIVLSVPYTCVRLNTVSPNIWQVTSIEVKPTPEPGSVLEEPITQTITANYNQNKYTTNLSLSTLTVSSLASFSSFTAKSGAVLGQFITSTFSTLGSAAIDGDLHVNGDASVKNAVLSTLTVYSMAYFSSFFTSSFTVETGSVSGLFTTSAFSTLADGSVGGLFTATSFSTLGSASVYGTLEATSFSTLANASVYGTFTATSLSTIGDAAIAGTLTTTSLSTIGDAAIAGTLTTTFLSTIGDAAIAGTLTTTFLSTIGDAAIAGTLTATSFSTLGNASIHGDLYVKGVLYTPGGGGGGGGDGTINITNPVVETCSTLTVSSMAYFSSFSATTGSVLGQFTTTSFKTLADAYIGGTLSISKPVQEEISNIQKWIAVGKDTNKILTSVDGFTWTPVTGTSFTTSGNGLAWNGSLWVAVGSGIHTILTSRDGSTWSAVSGTSFSEGGGYGNSVAWNGSLWVAVGAGIHTILTSPDGNTWSAVSGTSFSEADGAGISVAWNGSLWVAVGYGVYSILYSFDGITWSPATGTNFSQGDGEGMSVAWNGLLWVAVGSLSGGILTSSDGITWSSTGISGYTFSKGYGIDWNGSLWVAVGYQAAVVVGDGDGDGDEGGGGNGSANGIHTILYSSDGYLWKSATGTTFTNYGIHVTWNGSMWVAVGKGTHTILYSYNGIAWSESGVTGAFTTAEESLGKACAYTTALEPFLTTKNLEIYSQGKPSFLTSTCKILATPDFIVLNDSLFINMSTNSVGVNINPIDSMNSFIVNGSLSTFADASVYGTLTTTSLSTLSNASIVGTLTTTSLSTLSNASIVGMLTTTSLSTFADASIVGTLTTTSLSTLSNASIVGTLTTTSLSTFAGASIVGTLTTTSLSTLSDASVYGTLTTTSLSTVADASVYGTLTTTSFSTVADASVYGTLTTTFLRTYGDAFIDGDLYVKNVLYKPGQSSDVGTYSTYSTLTVSSIATFSSFITTSGKVTGHFVTSTISTFGRASIGDGIITIPKKNTRLLVAVGNGTNQIKYSPDGIIWNSVSDDGFTGFGIASYNSYSVAVGTNSSAAGGTIKCSINGVIIQNSRSGAFATGSTNGGRGIAIHETRWVAVGYDPSGNTIRYSDDGGVNWTNSSGGFEAGTTYGGHGVATNGTRWVAVGSASATIGTIKHSTNGSTWTNSTSDGFTPGGNFGGRGVATNGTLWVAVGFASTTPGTIQYSINGGVEWTDSSGGFEFSTNSYGGYGVATNGTRWVAVGSSSSTPGTIKYSDDGSIWINCTSGGFSTGSTNGGRGVATDGTRWVAVGSASTAAGTIKYSTDGGVNWNNCSSGGFSIRGNSVTWNGSKWIAVGEDASGYKKIQYSSDGISWYSINDLSLFVGYSVSYGNNCFVSVGSHTTSGLATIRYSTDGFIWSNATSGGFLVDNNYGGRGVATDGTRWVAVGFAGAELYTIQYSVNRLTWTNCSSGGFGTGSSYGGRGVATNGTVWVAVGYDPSGNTIKYSTDGGVNWINKYNLYSYNTYHFEAGPDYGGHGVATDGTRWVAVGSASATKGKTATIIHWNSSGSPSFVPCYSGGFPTGSTYGGRGVATNGALWVAVGYSSIAAETIQYSTNLADWINSTSGGFSVGGNSITWDGLQWIAVGQDASGANTIKISKDGRTWTNSTSGAFEGGSTGQGYGVAWNLDNGIDSVYINTDLSVYGSIEGTSFTTTSDKRLKTNVQPIENALDKINRLRGVYYTHIKQPMYRSVGVIAQEVEEVIPEVVNTDRSIQAYKSVEYGNFAALFIEGIKSLTQELDIVKAEVSTLKGPTV